MDGPAGIVQEGSRERHRIGPVLGDQPFGMFGVVDQADSPGADIHLLLHLLGKTGLVVGADPDLGRGCGRTRGHADVVAAGRLQPPDEFDRIVDGPARIVPVGGGNLHPQRLSGGPDVAHGLHDLDHIAHPVVEAAAIGIGPMVRQGRQEGMQEVAMRPVDLEHVEADAQGAAGGVAEGRPDALQILGCGGARGGEALAKGDGRGRDRFPPALLGRQRTARGSPGHVARCLAAGMVQLQPKRRLAHRPAGCDNAGQRLFLRIRIEPETGRGPAAFSIDMGGLDHHQPRAGVGERAVMDKMPVVRGPVLCRVLRHGRDDDPVCKLQIGQAKGRKECGHGLYPSCGGHRQRRRRDLILGSVPCAGG